MRPPNEIRVGEELPELRKVVERADLLAYAEAGGDLNPLHTDDEVARSAGFPSVMAHGMFTMGHMAACLVAWTGDPGSVTALSASFRSPVYPGDELVAGGRVSSIDGDTVTVDLWVTVERDGTLEWPIKRGHASVRVDAAQAV